MTPTTPHADVADETHFPRGCVVIKVYGAASSHCITSQTLILSLGLVGVTRCAGRRDGTAGKSDGAARRNDATPSATNVFDKVQCGSLAKKKVKLHHHLLSDSNNYKTSEKRCQCVIIANLLRCYRIWTWSCTLRNFRKTLPRLTNACLSAVARKMKSGVNDWFRFPTQKSGE